MNKEERNAIYREWLKIFIGKSKERAFRICLCDCIPNLSIGISTANLKYDSIKQYPEIIKHMPKHSKHFEIWFSLDENGYNKRVSILEQAIKETE